MPQFFPVLIKHYKFRKVNDGFLIATFQHCQLTVIIIKPEIITPPIMNIHQLKAILKAKSDNQLFIANQAIGTDIINENKYHLKISTFINLTIDNALAPLTFRITISFVLLFRICFIKL
jgi:hypothetical protein